MKKQEKKANKIKNISEISLNHTIFTGALVKFSIHEKSNQKDRFSLHVM